jgi:GAF domain-containing protein
MSDRTPENEDLAAQLRRLLLAIEVSGQAVLPSTNLDLLQSIVDAAARIFGAAAASISLIDEQAGELVFQVSYGIGREDIVGMRIPVDQGIAGYVAMTGQPIAISDVQKDPRFKQDFAESTGYVPQSILSTPLISGERIIGVMQVLDKIHAPSFGLQDMELLGVFAHQAAIAINQSQRYDMLGEALVNGMRALLEEDADQQLEDLQPILTAASDEDETLRQDLFELADLINEISGEGPAERRMCLQVLSAFVEYLRTKPSFDFDFS